LTAAFLVCGNQLTSNSFIAQERSPELKSRLEPLGRLVGTWEKRWTVYKSEWSAEEQVKTGTHTSKWILNDRHLQTNGQDSDGSSYLSIYSYDPATQEYKSFAFQSTGLA